MIPRKGTEIRFKGISFDCLHRHFLNDSPKGDGNYATEKITMKTWMPTDFLNDSPKGDGNLVVFRRFKRLRVSGNFLNDSPKGDGNFVRHLVHPL